MTFLRRVQFGSLLLTTALGAHAAQTLPALQVDPSLLGAETPQPQPAPAAASGSAQAAGTAAPANASPTTATQSAPAQVDKPLASSAKPAVQPAPAAQAGEARSDENTSSSVSGAAPGAVQATAAVASPPAVARQTVQILPALQVDPALLGAAPTRTGLPAAPAVAAADVALPPQVQAAPRIAPLYSAHVEAGLLPVPDLKLAARLSPIVADPKASYPVFLAADRIHGHNDGEAVAEGDAELRKAGTVVTADKLTYWQLDDETEAEGNVKLARENGTMSGPKLRMQHDESVGRFDKPDYVIQQMSTLPAGDPVMQDLYAPPQKNQGGDLSKFGFTSSKPVTVSQAALAGAKMQAQRVPTTGSGSADRLDFEGEGQYHFTNATYTTCPVGKTPGWYAQANDLRLDYDRETASGTDGKIVFQGVPILYSPWLDFSLNNNRQSGLLAPHFGTNSVNGFEFDQPWYWNIAPNMDAIIDGHLMQRRGTQLGTDFRYKNYNYTGDLHFQYLPDDHIYGQSRYAYGINHTQNFGQGVTGTLNLNGVSDYRYFTDLTTDISAVTQGNQLRQGTLSYGASWWSASIMAQKYQVLQDPSITTGIPYARLPQVTVTGTRADLPAGLTFSGQGEYVRFSHPTLVTGTRSMAYPQLSLPLQTAAFYVTPKVGINYTRYTLEQQDAGVPNQITRSVPIFSLDSGVTFERPLEWLGKNFTQTLEPRLYYLYVPYRDQSQIPLFDTSLADFNFAQIFSENRYSGNDRIGDANQLTAAVTSRLIDPDTGAELIRAMLGQRYYFTDQRVTLPATDSTVAETPRTTRTADYLTALSGQVYRHTYIDTAWEYDPANARTERLNVGGRYQPEAGKVINAGYRYTRDLLGQVDVSGQWPLGGRWLGVGRFNYSTKDNRPIENLVGLEYNAGCWALRGVIHRLSTTAQTQTTSFFIQLELNGFSSIGSNPFDVLKRNVGGYSRANADSGSTD